MVVVSSQANSEKGLRVYVKTCPDYYNSLYPIAVSENKSHTFRINTGTKPKNGYFKVIIGIDSCPDYDKNTFTVTVNDAKTTQLKDVPKESGFVWKISENFEPPANHVSEVAPRVMQFITENMDRIHTGENTITIRNLGKAQKIKWLEVHVEET